MSNRPLLTLPYNAGTTPRIRGRKLQRLRRQAMQNNPLCVNCEAHGRVRVATERDHIIPLFKGGEDKPSNCQMLCGECHADKTAQDMGYKPRPRIGADGWPVDSK